jgi:cytochrome bd-type quinol oxidase subunit 1
MRFIGYYHLTIGLIFYTLGILLLYEGARSGVYQKLINTEILIPIIGVIVALGSIVWGIIKIGMGISDLMEGEENG